MARRTVSVVIPSYNASHTLKRSIDSVLGQTVAPDEILVVDDGSTDNPAQIVKQYGAAVGYLYQANQGLSGARNSGIRETTGEWLAFHDADDEWLPTKLERQHALLDRHPDLVWCACNVEEARRSYLYPGVLPESVRSMLEAHGRGRFFRLAAAGVLFAAGAFLIQRSVFATVGLFDLTLRTGGDRDMWWRIALRWREIGYVPEVGFRWYTGTPGSLSKINRDRSRGVRTVRDAAHRAKALGEQAWKDFEPYGRLLGVDYQIRQASREVHVDAALIRELAAIFPPSPVEAILIQGLRLLPASVAKRVARRLRPRALASRLSPSPHGRLGPAESNE